MIKKSILGVAVLVLSLTAFAQNTKKVAVWETKCSDKSISSFQSTMVRGGMETAVGNSAGYEVFDRTAFDAIMKEHKFQRSGAVSDAEIKRMGEMAGVQYIIVPEASMAGGEFYIIVKMLDVESGKFGGVFDALCAPTGAEIRKACQELGGKLFGSSNGGSSSSRPTGTASQSKGTSTLTFKVGNVSFEMVFVMYGAFTMGCTPDQGSECENDESPSQRVSILNSFYIGKYEVTQELYEAVMGVNPSHWKASNRPVENVSWYDAQEFCNKLSSITGRRFSLPTEAEWEYAARGGKKSSGAKYSGLSSVDDVAWYDGNSSNQTHPVGKLCSNELGIYDMSGNVWEWCQDWYGSYDDRMTGIDPKGPSSGSYRVRRGGSWDSGAKNCRVADRLNSSPSSRGNYLGFRVVLVP